MGVVFRARDVRLRRSVAIKLLPPELAFREEVRSRFLREAQTAAQLSHPNIVPIYSVDEVDGLVFFVMALVEGESLGAHIKREGRVPLDVRAPRAARRRRRARLRARARDRPSRHQARQHPDRSRDRAHAGHRLRDRAGGGRRLAPDASPASPSGRRRT